MIKVANKFFISREKNLFWHKAKGETIYELVDFIIFAIHKISCCLILLILIDANCLFA